VALRGNEDPKLNNNFDLYTTELILVNSSWGLFTTQSHGSVIDIQIGSDFCSYCSNYKVTRFSSVPPYVLYRNTPNLAATVTFMI
jgi:hypothetical protein